MTNEIATREEWGAPSPSDAPIVPATVGEITAFVDACMKAGAMPRSYESIDRDKRAGAMVVAIMKGKELGMLPLQALQSIYVVNGVPTIYGDALPAYAMGSGQVAAYRDGVDGQGDARFGWCEVERVGVKGVVRREFSVADAQRQGLLGKKGPWQHSRDRMLIIRARTYAFRDMFADALRGLGVAEEQHDIQTSMGIDAAPLNSTRRLDVLSDERAPHIEGEFVTPAAGESSTGAEGGAADGPPANEAPPVEHHFSDGDDFPGDRPAPGVFVFKLTDSRGEERQTTDATQWAAALVGMLTKAPDDEVAAIWRANSGHVDAASDAGFKRHAQEVWSAAGRRGVEVGE